MSADLPAPSMIVELSRHGDFLGAAGSSSFTFSSLMPRSSVIALPPVRWRCLRHGLRRSPSQPDGSATRATEHIGDQGRQSSPSVSSAMIKRGLPILAVCSSNGSRSFIELIFFVDEDANVLEDAFHALRVSNEVGREVAAVKLHADYFKR